MFAPQVIAFDLFGTLVEMTARRHPYAKAIRLLGLAPKAARRQAMTSPLSFQEFFKDLSREDTLVLKNALDIELESIRCFPEVPLVLKQLRERGYRLCVISNLAAPYAAAMDRLPRHLFEAEIMSFEVGAIKPDAAIYKEAAKQMGVPLMEMWMVGDSLQNDVLGALSAGVGSAQWLERSAPDIAVSRLDMLLDLLP